MVLLEHYKGITRATGVFFARTGKTARWWMFFSRRKLQEQRQQGAMLRNLRDDMQELTLYFMQMTAMSATGPCKKNARRPSNTLVTP